MGYAIKIVNGFPELSYERDDTIATDIALSLLVRRGAFFADPGFGLPELPKKLTDQNVALVSDYCRQALQWLKDIGRAKSIEVLAERVRPDRVSVLVTAVQAANNRTVTFQTFVPVI